MSLFKGSYKKSNNCSQLEHVPIELLSYILKFLAIHTRLALKITSHSFNNAVEQSIDKPELLYNLTFNLRQTVDESRPQAALFQQWCSYKQYSTGSSRLSRLYFYQPNGQAIPAKNKKQAFAQINESLKSFEVNFGNGFYRDVQTFTSTLSDKYYSAYNQLLSMLLEITRPNRSNPILESDLTCWLKNSSAQKNQLIFDLVQMTWEMLGVVNSLEAFLTKQHGVAPEYLTNYRMGLNRLYNHINKLSAGDNYFPYNLPLILIDKRNLN
jgi:hypothetical protein